MGRPFSPQLPLMAAAALGVSSAVFLDTLAQLTSPSHLFIYHFSGSPSAIFVAAIADVLILTAVCLAAFLRVSEGTKLHRLLWSAILCIYPWIVTTNICIIMGVREYHAVSIAIFLLCGTAFLLLTLVRSEVVDHAFAQVQEFGMMVLVAAGVVGAFALVETAFFAVKARHLNDQTVAETLARPVSVAPHGRVLWIILDELAYRQLYEDRLPDLHLPAFDRFRAESTVFSNVQPAGIQTEIVVPALMTGDPVDQIHSSSDGSLTLHDARGWHAFDERNTVFADADALGYRTSVVGWFNPYCRMLPSVLGSCYWVNYSVAEGFTSDRSAVSNLLHPILYLAAKLLPFDVLRKHALPLSRREDGEEHIRTFVELDHASDAALTDPRNNFLLLHMPVPHPGGIWDRRTGQFAIYHSCYVDNLALADAYLDHVRRLLGSDQWDNTTVVIMGDHAWRTTQIWDGTTGWNAEDQLASDGGRYDPRPAYIIKLPHQHTAATVQTAFPAVRTRPLLDQILLGRIATPAQLEQWVTGVPQAQPLAQTRGGVQGHSAHHS